MYCKHRSPYAPTLLMGENRLQRGVVKFKKQRPSMFDEEDQKMWRSG